MIHVLYDSFFHMRPGHRIGRNVATGGYTVNVGRYSLGDCYHPNGLGVSGGRTDRRLFLPPVARTLHGRIMAPADILMVCRTRIILSIRGVAPSLGTGGHR